MNFWVGVTDNDWFDFLSKKQPDEINFWKPSGKGMFKVLSPGGLFLFKLKYPLNYIVGGGYFVRHLNIPLSMAWEAFGDKNGVSDLETLKLKIIKYRGEHEPNPVIGCSILSTPFFFKREQWIPIPSDWSSNIVSGKTYDNKEHTGATLLAAVQERILFNQSSMLHHQQYAYVDRVAEEEARYGSEYLTKARLGQGTFRILVTEAYSRKCSITGERTLPVLEASHIKPFSLSGPNAIDNGLLLRSDLHKLFDLGYLTITKDYHVEVSKRIRVEYENGREYYALHGQQLKILPPNLIERPSVKYIEWHNQNIYVP